MICLRLPAVVVMSPIHALPVARQELAAPYPGEITRCRSTAAAVSLNSKKVLAATGHLATGVAETLTPALPPKLALRS